MKTLISNLKGTSLRRSSLQSAQRAPAGTFQSSGITSTALGSPRRMRPTRRWRRQKYHNFCDGACFFIMLGIGRRFVTLHRRPCLRPLHPLQSSRYTVHPGPKRWHMPKPGHSAATGVTGLGRPVAWLSPACPPVPAPTPTSRHPVRIYRRESTYQTALYPPDPAEAGSFVPRTLPRSWRLSPGPYRDFLFSPGPYRAETGPYRGVFRTLPRIPGLSPGPYRAYK